MGNKSTSGRDRPSCLFIVPFRSIGEEHINSNDFDLSVKGFEKNVDVLNEMKNNNFQDIDIDFISFPLKWVLKTNYNQYIKKKKKKKLKIKDLKF